MNIEYTSSGYDIVWKESQTHSHLLLIEEKKREEEVSVEKKKNEKNGEEYMDVECALYT